MSEAIHSILAKIAAGYPTTPLEYVRGRPTRSLRDAMLSEIDRFAFEVSMVSKLVPPGGTVADVGGGICLFSPGLSVLGYKSILIDDFRDRWHGVASAVLENHKFLGVQIVSCDILTENMGLSPASIDAITCFDCIEHLHSSPKAMLHALMSALNPGGIFFLGVPNCVNIRKRMTVPFGVGKWSQMAEWYEESTFRGHVREPDVDDLRCIARDLALTDFKIIGRNWLGYSSRFGWVRTLTPVFDRMLRIWPGLCSNIYLIGRKAIES